MGDLSVSVVVNTTDRANPVRTLLQALEQQSYSRFEVIVVVGPTRDDTLEQLRGFEGRIRLLRCARANLSLSRNIGLLAARGDIVAYIDDDAVPSRAWLEQLAVVFKDETLDASGGTVYLAHPNDPRLQHHWGSVSSLAEQTDVRVSRAADLPPRGEGARWLTRMMGTNMAYRRQSLLAVGGFDGFYEWVYDESDLNLRMANAGLRVDPVGQAVVYHFPASSRNRVAFTYNGKWWIQTKAAIYFALKNGPASGDGWRAITRRCLRLFHGHWLSSRAMVTEGKITRQQFARMRVNEMVAAINGSYNGLLRPRQTAAPAAIAQTRADTGPILSFQDARSPRRPAVDPVSARRPEILMTEPPLRIALLSSAYPPNEIEGVGRHTNLMARGLFECGHTVHVIARGPVERVSFYDGAYVHRLPVKLERYGRYGQDVNLYWALNHSHGAYQKVLRLMANDGLQIVDTPIWQLDGLVTCLSGALSVVARLQTATRQVNAIQGTLDEDARLVGEMEETLVQRAAHLMPNSRASLEAASKVYNLEPRDGQFTIIPHGIAPVPDEAARPFDVGRADATRLVLYVGRLERRKGILDLFEAIPRVLAAAPRTRFIIAGADNSQNDGFQARTGLSYPADFARRFAGALPNVTFAGAVSDDALNALYQSCDLFVAPSLYESFGLIYTEAMNYAKPVIGCRAGGVPEVIEDGVTGLLVDPEAPAELAEAIISLLASPARLRDLGLAGRRRLLDRFTHIQMARQFADVYRRVIAERNA